MLDGVYRHSADGTPDHVGAAAPSDEALQAVLRKLSTRTMKLLARRGVLVEEIRPAGPILYACPMSPPAPPDAPPEAAPSPHPRRVFLLGATGTIGRATARALVQRGHRVDCFVRQRSGVGGTLTPDDVALQLPGTTLRVGDVSRPDSMANDGFRGERFDVLVSCLASRTGAPADAWAIDSGHAALFLGELRGLIEHATLVPSTDNAISRRQEGRPSP